MIVPIYAPLPGASLSFFVRRLRFAVPQWHDELKSALQRAEQRPSHTRVDGVGWYWPTEEDAARRAPQDTVRLLSPFDPVVRDRGRFELLWGWVYRFEAYTPRAQAQARLLRSATALARLRDWLGQPLGELLSKTF